MLRHMARLARTVIPGVPHHVTQRGNNRQDVFFVDDDRRFYLQLLREQCDKHGLEVSAYCLMTNHLHLPATPEKPDSPAPALSPFINLRFGGRAGGNVSEERFSPRPPSKDFPAAVPAGAGTAVTTKKFLKGGVGGNSFQRVSLPPSLLENVSNSICDPVQARSARKVNPDVIPVRNVDT